MEIGASDLTLLGGPRMVSIVETEAGEEIHSGELKPLPIDSRFYWAHAQDQLCFRVWTDLSHAGERVSVTVTLLKNQWQPLEQPFPVPGRATTSKKQGDSSWPSEAPSPTGKDCCMSD